MIYCLMQLKSGVDLVEVWKVDHNEGRATPSAGKLIFRVEVIIGRAELYLASMLLICYKILCQSKNLNLIVVPWPLVFNVILKNLNSFSRT